MGVHDLGGILKRRGWTLGAEQRQNGSACSYGFLPLCGAPEEFAPGLTPELMELVEAAATM